LAKRKFLLHFNRYYSTLKQRPSWQVKAEMIGTVQAGEESARLQEVSLLFCNDATDRALDQMEELARATPSLNAWFICGGWAASGRKPWAVNAWTC